jgi:hypothetical protein
VQSFRQNVPGHPSLSEWCGLEQQVFNTLRFTFHPSGSFANHASLHNIQHIRRRKSKMMAGQKARAKSYKHVTGTAILLARLRRLIQHLHSAQSLTGNNSFLTRGWSVVFGLHTLSGLLRSRLLNIFAIFAATTYRGHLTRCVQLKISVVRVGNPLTSTFGCSVWKIHIRTDRNDFAWRSPYM